ncbi:MAG: helix-turn-helix transcriptional regulator, partial [Streptomycetaceae bacterium]|nr:helix-turn-helix transcriptional regulator [Streptomycetaceae bacterium]
MPENPPERTPPDVEAIKVFTHPLRMRLLRLLRSEGPATASVLARVLGTTPSLISYHLRAMARHGFIAEDPDASPDGRERRWIAVHDLRFSTADFADDEIGREVADAVVRVARADMNALYEKSLRRITTMGRAWQDAAFAAHPALRLTAAELQELHDELTEVVDRYRGLAATTDDGTARERVQLELLGFPYE